jgi:hypothetical protein
MSWIKGLFGIKAQPRNALEEAQKIAATLIPIGYRRIASLNGCAPTPSTSDSKIMEIYKTVGTAFRDVSHQRGEHLKAEHINTIVLKFLQIHEKMSAEFFSQHLAYEVDLYAKSGLRTDYQRDLKLF